MRQALKCEYFHFAFSVVLQIVFEAMLIKCVRPDVGILSGKKNSNLRWTQSISGNVLSLATSYRAAMLLHACITVVKHIT